MEKYTKTHKKCNKCLVDKKLVMFNKSSYSKDGYDKICKDCEAIRQCDKYKRNKDKIDNRNDLWKEKNRKHISEYNKKHYAKNKEKYKAKSIVYNAIISGLIKRKDKCEDCNSPSSHAHHEDYSKPLDVIWLCNSCHQKRHSKINSQFIPMELS